MNDRSFIQSQIIEVFNSAPIKIATGMVLHYNEQGQAVFDFPRAPQFDHAMGDVHGGLIATLLDNAGWFTVAAHYASWVVTVEFHVRLLEPANQEALQAIGKIVRAGKRLATAEMQVNSDSGRLVACGSGTFAITSQQLNPG